MEIGLAIKKVTTTLQKPNTARSKAVSFYLKSFSKYKDYSI